MASLTGTTIDKYEMMEEVGHGGMAVVYRGRDRVLDREVAVKVLHPHLADRQESRLRLQREAIAVAKLRHENILEIFDYSGPEADASYIVTEFIHGPTLRDWIESNLVPRPPVAAMIVHRLCLALTHAHKSAIVHRDIKPENVMIRIDDGVLKLMDFGIAQIIDNNKLTLTGQLIGSPAYMAPELISGRPLDARTDLFSLGILLYQLATGELPFNGRNPHEVLTRIADGQYPAPSTVCPLVDRDFEAIIDRALALNPDERYQSVDTFGKELEEYLGEMGIEPTTAELAGYFHEPVEYIAELDARVCAALVEQANRAGAAGSTARAIRLLGRVLEIEPAHGGAVTMLGRFKQRERRSRQVLLLGASLALAGLVGAGYVLMPEHAFDPDRIGRGAPASTLALAAGSHDDATHAADAAVHDDAGPIAGGESTSGAARSVTSDAAPDAQTDGPTDGETTDGTGSTPKPRDHVGTRPPPGLRPKIKPDATAAQPCTIVLEGLPAAQLASTRISVGGTMYDVSGTRVDVELPADGAQVTVKHKRYEGSRRVLAHQCPASLTAEPKPATVSFQGIPGDTSVRCSSGCSSDALNVNQLASNFGAVEIHEGAGQVIKVTFQHPEFDDLTKSYHLVPGHNPIDVRLKPRGG